MRRSGDLIDRRPKTVAGLRLRGASAAPLAAGRPVSEKEEHAPKPRGPDGSAARYPGLRLRIAPGRRQRSRAPDPYSSGIVGD